MISIDWLTVNCIRKKDLPIKNSISLEFVKWNKGTSFFREVYEVYNYKKSIATIFLNPPEKSVLNQDSLQIKLTNNLLYQHEAINTLKNLIRHLNAEYKNVSRIDLCMDFKKFDSGHTPNQFISSFINKRIVKLNSKFFKIVGYNNNHAEINGLAFGKRSSDVYIQLYNKSSEIRDSSGKTYVIKAWEANGMETITDTYRLEFALRNDAIELVNKDTGEILSLHKLENLNPKYITNFFNMLLSKHFQFVLCEQKSEKKKMKPVKLFDRIKEKIVYLHHEQKSNPSLSDKILINKLIKNLERPDLLNKIDIEYYTSMISRLVDNLDLYKWFSQCHPSKEYLLIHKPLRNDSFLNYLNESKQNK